MHLISSISYRQNNLPNGGILNMSLVIVALLLGTLLIVLVPVFDDIWNPWAGAILLLLGYGLLGFSLGRTGLLLLTSLIGPTVVSQM